MGDSILMLPLASAPDMSLPKLSLTHLVSSASILSLCQDLSCISLYTHCTFCRLGSKRAVTMMSILRHLERSYQTTKMLSLFLPPKVSGRTEKNSQTRC